MPNGYTAEPIFGQSYKSRALNTQLFAKLKEPRADLQGKQLGKRMVSDWKLEWK
jgi:hypothetical protein